MSSIESTATEALSQERQDLIEALQTPYEPRKS